MKESLFNPFNQTSSIEDLNDNLTSKTDNNKNRKNKIHIMKRFIDNMMNQVLKKNASNSVSTTVTIPDESITNSKLENKSVTSKKIADGTITLDNLSSEVKAKLNS